MGDEIYNLVRKVNTFIPTPERETEALYICFPCQE
jgi:translation elongation factor EF-Tu-like GTPase